MSSNQNAFNTHPLRLGRNLADVNNLQSNMPSVAPENTLNVMPQLNGIAETSKPSSRGQERGHSGANPTDEPPHRKPRISGAYSTKNDMQKLKDRQEEDQIHVATPAAPRVVPNFNLADSSWDMEGFFSRLAPVHLVVYPWASELFFAEPNPPPQESFQYPDPTDPTPNYVFPVPEWPQVNVELPPPPTIITEQPIPALDSVAKRGRGRPPTRAAARPSARAA